MGLISGKVKLLLAAIIILACIPNGICKRPQLAESEPKLTGYIFVPLNRNRPHRNRQICNAYGRYSRPAPLQHSFPSNAPTNDINFPTDPPSLLQKIVTSPTNNLNVDNSKAEILDRSDSCQGPDGVIGVCTPLARCQLLANRLLTNPKDGAFANFLRVSNRICGNQYAVVCCPLSNSNRPQLIVDTSPIRLPTVSEGCGQVRHKEKGGLNILVVGGKPSALGAWPWIALLGYNIKSGSPFKCGGTLITRRHILTAAHCIRSDLSFVRLAEHDLSTDTETKHVDIPIAKTVRHPQYNQMDGHSDIALVHLAQDVEFSEFIVPICLPVTPELRTKPPTDTYLEVAGWGKTAEGGESATILQELQLPIVDNALCKDVYEKRRRLFSARQFDDGVICAGDLEGGSDTCQGDSGGPLMLGQLFGGEKRYHLYGIVSYSIGCARSEIPGVYTSVVNFIDWIQNEVAK